MQESIGVFGITIVVITLILLFTGVITLTINRSNAIALKSQIVDLIENNGGFDMKSEAEFKTNSCIVKKGDKVLCDILEKMDETSYRQTGGSAEKSNQTCYKRDGSISNSSQQASFCIRKLNASASTSKTGKNASLKSYYYDITVFYSMDIPILKQLVKFKLEGQTKLLYR